GTASTTNSISPSVTSPITTALSTTNTVATTVAAATSTTTTNTRTPSVVSASTSISGSDLWRQNWAFQPISDPDKLRRLRALYLFAVNGDPHALSDNYPLIVKSVNNSVPLCLTNGITGRPVEIESHADYHPNSEFQRDGTLKNAPTAP